jgi:hypothetical protein
MSGSRKENNAMLSNSFSMQSMARENAHPHRENAQPLQEWPTEKRIGMLLVHD